MVGTGAPRYREKTGSGRSVRSRRSHQLRTEAVKKSDPAGPCLLHARAESQRTVMRLREVVIRRNLRLLLYAIAVAVSALYSCWWESSNLTVVHRTVAITLA